MNYIWTYKITANFSDMKMSSDCKILTGLWWRY